MPKILKKPEPTSTTAAKVAAAQPGKKEVAAPPPAPVNGDAKHVEVVQRKVIYPKVEAEICVGENALTAEVMKMVLGWETEAQYQERMMKANPGTKKEHWTFGEAYMLIDENGEKVQCFHNLDNRPFDQVWARSLAEVHLLGQWASGLTIPGGSINGSTMVLSCTGKMESGQHSGVGLILAQQILDKNPDKYPFWRDRGGVVLMETIIIKGISEDPRVTMTVDNCKPRSMSDVFYTSEIFRKKSTTDRKECSKMMSNAVDHAWKRTAAQGYKTPPELVGFVDRHPRLVKCVEHLFEENKAGVGADGGRKINKLRITPGLAASLCYLMGCSGPKTDGDVYRNGFPPSERDCDWERWTKAREFWAMIGGHEQLKWVRAALAQLYESATDNADNPGLGGRLPERLAVVQKAWDTFIAYDPSSGAPMFNPEDLAEGGALYLEYTTTDEKGAAIPDGGLRLLDQADFGGIDLPGETKGEITGPPPKTSAEIEAEKAKIQQERVQAEQQQKVSQPSAKAIDAVAKLKALAKKKEAQVPTK